MKTEIELSDSILAELKQMREDTKKVTTEIARFAGAIQLCSLLLEKDFGSPVDCAEAAKLMMEKL